LIVLQFDDAYYQWGLLMLQSLALHEPLTAVLCNTVNLADTQVAELRGAHGRLEITNGVAGGSSTPELMAARKPFVVQHAMDHYPDQPWYALLDADFLVRRPLDELWSLLDHNPVALCITDGYEYGIFYPQLVTPSGIVLVRPDGRTLIDRWAKWTLYGQPLGGIAPYKWFWDQLTLAEAWKEAWKEVSLPYATIDMAQYYDDALRPGSAIWSANVGDRKQRYYELFREEYQRQRSISR
jgi:hypothetical protein